MHSGDLAKDCYVILRLCLLFQSSTSAGRTVVCSYKLLTPPSYIVFHWQGLPVDATTDVCIRQGRYSFVVNLG